MLKQFLSFWPRLNSTLQRKLVVANIIIFPTTWALILTYRITLAKQLQVSKLNIGKPKMEYKG